ncbi:uncharacterized protein isoform X2 [Rhodnius prolixus]|uniref:uncharacterized protein isoform X2 n=1 Tax=Rhodnius prolixus TaxID=13249 RepID=UPI003D18B9B1
MSDSDEVYTFSTSSKEVQGDDIILDEDNAHVEGGERLVSVEIDHTTDTYLMKALRKKSVDLKGLAEEWWRTHNTDPDYGLKEIIELLFHSTGWKSYTFQNTLDEGAIRKYIKRKVKNKCETLNWNFIDRLGDFFETLLEQNNNQILINESFMHPIVTFCTVLKGGLWTSYRMIAVIAGMKTMTRLHSYYEEIIIDLSAPNLPDFRKTDLKEKKETLFKYWCQLFQNVFKLAIRDVSCDVRRGAISEMFRWASRNPILLLGRRWQKYIYLALRDKNSFNRDLAFNMVDYLFINEIDKAKQIVLFNCLKIELFFAIQKMDGIPPYKSICVCTNLAKYADEALNQVERSLIYICVYYKPQIIAFKAAEYLAMQLKKMVNTPKALIKLIIVFNEESTVKTESLLIDVLYYFIQPVLSWDDWFDLIANSKDEKVEPSIAMFFAYVNKAVVSYSPKSRIKWKLLQMKQSDLMQNRTQFTRSLGQNWIKLMNMKKILQFPTALIRMIKILQFVGMQLSPEAITDICKKLSDIFLSSSEERVVCESCKSLQHLLTVAGVSRANLVTSVCNQLVDQVLAEFLEYIKMPLCTLVPTPIHNRIIYVSQSFDFDDQILWETCKNNLLTTSINKHSDELILALMTIYYSRLFYYIKLIEGLNSENNTTAHNSSLSSESDVESLLNSCDNSQDAYSSRIVLKSQLVNKINSRSNEALKTIKIFLSDKFSNAVNIMAFKIMATFIEYFGPHMSSHPTLWEFATHIEEDIEPRMTEIVGVAFQNDCLYKSSSEVESCNEPSECCRIIKQYCELLGEGILDWKNAMQIILLIKENKLHGDYLVNCLNAFLKKFPEYFCKPGYAIYNAVATSVKLELRKQTTSNRVLDSAKNILDELFINRKIKNPEGYQLVCLLHEFVIRQAYKKNGFKPLIMLLHPLRSVLKNQDIPKILQLLNEVKSHDPKKVSEYISLLKERQRLLK